MMLWLAIFLFVSIVRPFSYATAATINCNFYVSASSSSSGNGSQGSPWDLQTALNHPSTVKPGNTICVDGGTYKSSYTSHLKGASGQPIIVRAMPGQRAILDYHGINLNLAADTYYAWFWGLEFMDSHNIRDPNAARMATGIVATRATPASHDIKFINCYMHDSQDSSAAWYESNYNSEFYGNLIAFNGTRYVDHGIYVHNQTGNKWITDNLIGDNAGYGIHGYIDGTGKYINGVQATGNIMWNSASIGCKENDASSCRTPRPNILMGGTSDTANDPVIANNYTYQAGNEGGSLNLGYTAGSVNAKVTNNYFMGGPFVIGGGASGLQMSGNTIWYSTLSGTSQTAGNTWMASKPSGTYVAVRPNKYELGRANIAIYNWGRMSTVTIPADSLAVAGIVPGDTYELHNAQNYFGDVVSGTVSQSGIVVPMTGRSVYQPINLGWKAASTFPEFGAWILISQPSGIVPTASPTKTPTSTPTQVTAKPGDANNDGKVDDLDYVIWAKYYGSSSATGPIQGDFNGDKKTDDLDYVIWAKNYLI